MLHLQQQEVPLILPRITANIYLFNFPQQDRFPETVFWSPLFIPSDAGHVHMNALIPPTSRMLKRAKTRNIKATLNMIYFVSPI
jgi:hypothetical protein